ncbi:MAG: SDR family oxidoreductase [Planctomycetaceae bacterium]|jgi:3-oxoacyl-[acyl-carrier protein] reductase|nr:SDR family oxidoreductase [Planctomycetaceae bacterium]MBV8230991.1 SDR family oxidoreductase [Planctomycetaceae bacterium]MBV8268236.1 SDR family oxidoreductase [Planctomycetaceae bacterium]MBV8318523.1 SDR family oxidoreductase [Planctomycetaceae bacterium]MBV8383017.1 SDR family oxidoreductase [Planctomycetaceae bacterium]
MSVVIDLSGQAALVTGASQGIGAEIARALHRAGARVVINHPDQGEGRTRADADGLAEELNAARDGDALVLAADVADPSAVREMMRAVAERWGGIEILVNNAGILRDRSVAKMGLDDWRSVLDVNLSGVFHCCKYGLEILRDGGAIVNMGSLAAEAGFYGQANYAAAKAGVHALTRVLSRECARRSIRVNSVAPGVIDTTIMAAVPEPIRAEMVQAIPWRRFGSPQEIANAVLFLCSPLASYITGHRLDVDGGWRG